MPDHAHTPPDPPGHGIVFFVDKEKFESPSETLTPRQILQDYAKEDPAMTTLVEKHGTETIKYTDLDKPITLKNGMRFVVYHSTPTPVS
jgi:hypothetical protein